MSFRAFSCPAAFLSKTVSTCPTSDPTGITRRPPGLSRRGDQYLVEGGMLGPAARPIADANTDVGRAEGLQEILGMARKFLDDLDTPNLPGELGKDCGLDTGPYEPSAAKVG